MKLKQLIFLLTLFCIGFASCKKKKETPNGDRANLSRDSIFLYAKQIYLWSDALPTYEVFNPRKYTGLSTDILNYEKELVDLSQYKINFATGLPYEYYLAGKSSKYSTITDLADKNPTAFIANKKSSVDLEGNGNDFGLKLSVYDQGAPAYALFVTAVYPNSPADKAGMIRSNRITKINGRTLGDNITTDIDFLNSAIIANNITIEGVLYANGVSSGVPFTKSLVKASYSSSPVLAAKVFTADAKKIGYLAYTRFSRLSNSKPDFDAAFTTFSNAGVTDLIIDLRYNGGGYVSTAQYLINQIAPPSLNGLVMFTEHYNSLMQAGNATILDHQPLLDGNGKVQYQGNDIVTYADIDYSVSGNTTRFAKAGPLNVANNIKSVIFIVTGNTGSSSELVINSLKPHMTVKMVGTKTFGKPVGFFPITIENKYEVYYPLFQTKNSLGQGDYFDGFAPDVPFPSNDGRGNLDDPRNNFGDPLEYYTWVAINYIAPNSVITGAAKTMSQQGKNVSTESLQRMNPVINGDEFMGMIETRRKLKQ